MPTSTRHAGRWDAGWPRTGAGSIRRFTLGMLEDIILSCYRHHWFSMDKLKPIYRELLIAAHRATGEYKIPNSDLK